MADVSIDSTISTSSARGMRSVVFTSTTVGYWFYIDSGGTFVYKKTTDGGATWGAAVTIATATTHVAYDVWFDQWTPSDSGTLIHTSYFDVTNDKVFYRTLDTASDTLGTQQTVFTGASAVAGRGAFVSVTKTRSGFLYCAYDIDAGAEKGFHRSTNGGSVWSASLLSTFIEATIDQCLLFPASGTGDNDDCWALYHDASADAITLKLWDSSAAAQVESATIMTDAEDTVDLTGQYGFSAAVRHSDGHLIMAGMGAAFGVSHNFSVFDIASTSTFTAKTNISTAIANQYNPAVFIDQLTGDIYVAYEGKRDNSESASSKVYYVKSTDGGTTWSAGDTTYMQGAASSNLVQVWAPLMGPCFYVGWRDSTALNGNAANSLTFSAGGPAVSGSGLASGACRVTASGFKSTSGSAISSSAGRTVSTASKGAVSFGSVSSSGRVTAVGAAPHATAGSGSASASSRVIASGLKGASSSGRVSSASRTSAIGSKGGIGTAIVRDSSFILEAGNKATSGAAVASSSSRVTAFGSSAAIIAGSGIARGSSRVTATGVRGAAGFAAVRTSARSSGVAFKGAAGTAAVKTSGRTVTTTGQTARSNRAIVSLSSRATTSAVKNSSGAGRVSSSTRVVVSARVEAITSAVSIDADAIVLDVTDSYSIALGAQNSQGAALQTSNSGIINLNSTE